MRQARAGPLRRETIEELPQKFFYLSRSQLGVRSLQGGLSVQLVVRCRQEPPGFRGIAPDVLRRGDDARKTLGPRALLRPEMLFAALVGGCRNDAAHDFPPLPRGACDAHDAMAQSGLGKPAGNDLGQ